MQAALFDFDGVIVDSTSVHLEGWADAYRSLFKAELSHEFLASLIGRSTAAIGSILAVQSGYPSSKPELIRLKVSYVFRSMGRIPLIEGSASFLSELSKRQVPFGIVSNAPRDFIAAALQHHGLIVPFYLGLEDYRRPKPDAEPYMKGAQRLAWRFAEHRQIWVFEDSTHGLEAAIAAHMTPIGVCSQHEAAVLEAAGAEMCVANLREALEKILGAGAPRS